jgi:threonine/homoserine/homoserine lactone efflux protein
MSKSSPSATRSVGAYTKTSCSSLPRFLDRVHGHIAVQMLMLGLVFNAIAVVSDSTWGLVAATARAWFARSPRRLSLIGGVGD